MTKPQWWEYCMIVLTIGLMLAAAILGMYGCATIERLEGIDYYEDLREIADKDVPSSPVNPDPDVPLPPAPGEGNPEDGLAPEPPDAGDDGDSVETEKKDGITYVNHRPFQSDRKAGRYQYGWKKAKIEGYWERSLLHVYVTRHPSKPKAMKKNPPKRVTWSPKVEGRYQVWVGYRATPNRATKVDVRVDGKRVRINQWVSSRTYTGLQWARIGVFDLDKDSRVSVINGSGHSESAAELLLRKVGG